MDVLQRVKIDATSPSPIGLVSVRISPDMTSGGDHVAIRDIEQMESTKVAEKT